LRFGAARTGVDLEEAVVRVGLARQERFEAALLRRGLERPDDAFTLGDRGRVVLGLAELDQSRRVIQFLLKRPDDVDRLVELCALALQALRLLWIAPEIGIVRERVQLVETPDRLVPVKDASSAAPGTA
jgi:hypothetical protein